MRIWIDGYEANQPNRVGSGQYAFEILKNLEKINSDNEYTVLIPTPPRNDLPKERTNWKYRVLKPNKLWTRIALPLALYTSKNKPDVFFSPTHYIPRFSPVKRVCAIFDLAYLHFPEMFNQRDLYQLKNWTKYSIENSYKILAISEFTTQDIVENYKVSQEKIMVTPLGYDSARFTVHSSQYTDKAKKKYGIEGDYIIYIGTIQPRKNLVRLIEAFSKLTPSFDVKLVIVGKTTGPGRQGWKYEDILNAPKQFGVEGRVIFTGFAPTDDLPPLLSGSKLFVLPSLWEGFGIPVLEAMACGTPVVVSNVSSLPEVAGDAGTFIDPYSVDSIKEGIEGLLKDEKLRQKKIQLGLERVNKFSWENCARKTLETLMELQKNN